MSLQRFLYLVFLPTNEQTTDKENESHKYLGLFGMNSGLDNFNQIDETNYDVFPGMESMITDII